MDPIMTTIAAALAKEAVTSGKQALGKLLERVKERFAKDPGSEIVLASAQENPDDTKWVDALARVLDRTGEADPEFAAELRELWAAAKPEVHSVEQTASGHGVNNSNSISGKVIGNVVQAYKITGDIHGTAGTDQPSW
ncbi:hypothetical protein [Kutzneria buriramensis]|uniref:Uncharacterized protein n=1 Tax=Kutzneria buriramensis TaxID=1045776 RepID=A0A3E0I0J2_9PSEU|nr:hypothetical protein [Kutzneria buriramensis]REH52141.1 hypothetical protein BCF44_103592 [Kutzneria buriramensis]